MRLAQMGRVPNAIRLRHTAQHALFAAYEVDVLLQARFGRQGSVVQRTRHSPLRATRRDRRVVAG